MGTTDGSMMNRRDFLRNSSIIAAGTMSGLPAYTGDFDFDFIKDPYANEVLIPGERDWDKVAAHYDRLSNMPCRGKITEEELMEMYDAYNMIYKLDIETRGDVRQSKDGIVVVNYIEHDQPNFTRKRDYRDFVEMAVDETGEYLTQYISFIGHGGTYKEYKHLKEKTKGDRNTLLACLKDTIKTRGVEWGEIDNSNPFIGEIVIQATHPNASRIATLFENFRKNRKVVEAAREPLYEYQW